MCTVKNCSCCSSEVIIFLSGTNLILKVDHFHEFVNQRNIADFKSIFDYISTYGTKQQKIKEGCMAHTCACVHV